MVASKGPRKGRFITFEGGEGSGKSTQVKILVESLATRGIEAVATREPGGSPAAEVLRTALLSGLVAPLGPAAEAMIFSAARIDHLDKLIKPALARGAFVVCDRFADSTRAYQGALGNLSESFIDGLEHVTVGDSMPDLTFILDVPAEIGLARAARRRGDDAVDRFEAETIDFHRALLAAFHDIAERNPHRCVIIDAARRPNDVAALIWHQVEARLLSKTSLT